MRSFDGTSIIYELKCYPIKKNIKIVLKINSGKKSWKTTLLRNNWWSILKWDLFQFIWICPYSFKNQDFIIAHKEQKTLTSIPELCLYLDNDTDWQLLFAIVSQQNQSIKTFFSFLPWKSPGLIDTLDDKAISRLDSR